MIQEGFIPREVDRYFDRFRSKNGSWKKELENLTNIKVIKKINNDKVGGHKAEGHKAEDYMVNDYFDLACYIAYQVNNGGDGFTSYIHSDGSPYRGRLSYAAKEIFKNSDVFKSFDQKSTVVYKTYVVANYLIERYFPLAEKPLKMSLNFQAPERPIKMSLSF
jgi:hypothetical protein